MIIVMNSDEYLSTQGYCWFRRLFTMDVVNTFTERFQRVSAQKINQMRKSAGFRLSPDDWSDASLILHEPLLAGVLAKTKLGEARLIRVILFDKSPLSRWNVGWHRDTMIPVKEHHPSEQLIAHSVKDGIRHVQGTLDILSQMLSIRVHLDPVTEANGPLFVIPASHRPSSLSDAKISEREASSAEMCIAEAGDVFVFRPLLLHRSPKSTSSNHRRIVQFDITGNVPLPDGFEWP